MDSQLETLILRHLLLRPSYCRAVIPHLEKSYFGPIHGSIFEEICRYVQKYSDLPAGEQLRVELEESPRVRDEDYATIMELVDHIYEKEAGEDEQWMMDRTESWCQDSALRIAVMESVKILEGKHPKLDKGAIPGMMADALATGFDTTIGHDYFEDAGERWEMYRHKPNKVPVSLDAFMRATNGGIEKGTLNMFMAGVHVGKSLLMCHEAAMAVKNGHKVLYISMEMGEEKVAERIDANLLRTEIDRLEDFPKDQFVARVEGIKERSGGEFIAKQFPTGAAHVGHFRALLEDLKIKKHFVPTLIFVDYLNIMASSRIRGLGAGIGTYNLVKSIAEEVRGLAIEYNVPIWSATQVNRDGFDSSDISMTNTSESFGLPATVDLLWALSQNDEAKRSGQYFVKQLKNRYKNLDEQEKFVIGVNKAKMTVYDVESTEQSGLVTSSGEITSTQSRHHETHEFE